MAWIKVVEDKDADDELRRIYRRITGTRGRLSNIFLSQSLNPPALEAHLDLYLRVMFGQGPLSRLEREMIAVTVSRANQCEYCVAHHSAAMRNYVKDSRFVMQFAEGFRSAKLEPRHRTMLGYAVKLTEMPSSVTKYDIGALRVAGFGDEEILHIALVVSYFNFVNRLASGLGIRLEDDAVPDYKY